MTMMQITESFLPVTWAAVVTVLLFIYYKIRHRNILPGPSGFPYLGMWPYLQEEDVHLQLTEYGKKYGDVYSFTCTGKLFIHLGSVKSIREIFVSKAECFTSRFTDCNFLTLSLGNGVIMINGERWKVLRRFFLQNLKEYGVTATRENMLGPIYDTLPTIIEDLKAVGDAPFNVLDMMTAKCQVTLRKVLFGENGISNEQLRLLNKAYAPALETFSGVNTLLIGPVARLLFAILPKFRRSFSYHKLICSTIQDCITKIESSYDENYPTCIVESYFKERNERRRKNDPTWKYFTDQALTETLSQFIGDGIVGTSALISCFLNALTEHPEEQNKIYDEIVKVIGTNRLPTMSDKSNLSYTVAFMNEVLRTAVFFPIFPSVECTKETTIRGYRIPKGSITLLNFWSAHHDSETYDDPEKFNPYRFLPQSGKARPELPISFGIGKRSCIGEGLTMMESFLFLTTIVQNFHISYTNDSNTSSAYLLSGQLQMCVRPRTGV